MHLHLQDGEICCLPTDTTWGLTCDATNINAVIKLFYLKKRLHDKSVPIFAPSVEVAAKHFEISTLAERLIHRYWPGKLTLLLPRRQTNPAAIDYIHTSIISSEEKVAVRIPNSSRALKSMKENMLIVGTSANLSGATPATSLKDLKKQITLHHHIGDNMNVHYHTLDEELVVHGIPSTILDITNDKNPILIREGIIKYDEVMSYIKQCGLL
ncbi:L-threonylcarbamoyladenylate synthase [Candidatus Fokinia solitaria]|uniref:L-threonylcarbamoyladenylate synthase n=1 Tax=Candidatus Fokinia solitaria TaxID=1802984 RepID=UPI001314C9E2|nr:Sua5/YciO/YrdC/YwlC family protein [Candidatus Fokinia solitaria]